MLRYDHSPHPCASYASAALYGNRWFKNIFSLIIADLVATELDTTALAKKYKSIQQEIVIEIEREHALGLHSSDAFLLAWLPEEQARALRADQLETIAKFRRAHNYRFCLTPYFLERE